VERGAARMQTATAIEGGSVVLKAFSHKFITEEYLQWLHDSKVNKYLVKPRSSTTLADVKAYCEDLMQSDDNYFFALLLRSGGRHIGNVRLGPVQKGPRLCQYGMMIGDRKYHGRGIGTEAVSLAASFCFGALRMHKLFAEVVDENRAAVRIYEKNGFLTEGILKDHVFINSRYYDLRVMGVINPAER